MIMNEVLQKLIEDDAQLKELYVECIKKELECEIAKAKANLAEIKRVKDDTKKQEILKDKF